MRSAWLKFYQVFLNRNILNTLNGPFPLVLSCRWHSVIVGLLFYQTDAPMELRFIEPDEEYQSAVA